MPGTRRLAHTRSVGWGFLPRSASEAVIPRAGLTTDRLVAAAADLADEAGYENVTLAALARRFGVRDASLYAHVRGLRDLRTRMALLAGGEMTDRIAVAVAGRTGGEALAAFAGAYREYALAHPGRYAATLIPLDPSLAADSPCCAAPPRSPTACSAPTTWRSRTSPTPYACCAAPSTATARWRPGRVRRSP
ncbi:hypothetical protein SHKM778_30260 [Streptomyces sp. KM77-8]|uniref:HTH tetR-type domain-containing protein n=1 Tax=Streptomyces haneummycinicus TaxID=3074435 RepID=A0AAT9HH54_9ACTN